MATTLRFAYADPPYIGQARKHYRKWGGSEVDHEALINRLTAEYPDGWALSLSSSSLQTVLALCPADVRIGAWVKPFASFKPGVNPAYAWEPVIWRGGRAYTRTDATIRDWQSANITMRRGIPGAKPDSFCYWLFGLLNMQANDTLDDLFPGSGAVTRAWDTYRRCTWHRMEAPYGDDVASAS